jgi:hypothetical protein
MELAELPTQNTAQVLDGLGISPEGMGLYDAVSSTDKLDSNDAYRLLQKLRDWRAEESRRQRTNRFQQAIDADFYDHIQWQQEHIQELEARGQAPLTFNRVALAVDWMVGTQVRTRMDWNILGRGANDMEAAQAKTKVFKYLADNENAQQSLTAAFRDAAKVGIGWIENGVNTDPTQEILFMQSVSWRQMWFDSRSRHPDYDRDARYEIRDTWLDVDIARHMFWDRRALISQGAIGGGDRSNNEDQHNEELREDYDFTDIGRYVQASAWNSVENRRRRVLVSECWYKVPQRLTMIRGGQFQGECYDKTNAAHKLAIQTGDGRVVHTYRKAMRFAFWCSAGLLAEGPSPFTHDKFPITPIFWKRRDRDNMPYGAIRGNRDAQEDYNQRASRALWRLSTKRVMYEENAVFDEEQMLEDVNKPNAKIKFKSGGLAKFKIDGDADLAQGDLSLMDRDAAHMEYGSGITNESLGRETNANSGRAIQKRQDQSSVTTADQYDSYSLLFKKTGEIRLSNIEQYWTEEKSVRITDDPGKKPEFVDINKPHYDEASNQWIYLNDITKSKADFVVSSRDYRDSVREAMFESLMSLIAKLPPASGLKLLDIAFEMHPDIPNKKEVMARVRGVAGIEDPDAKKTPEQMAQEQKVQQRNEAVADAQATLVVAKAAAAQGEVEKIKAVVAESQAKITMLLAQGRKAEADALQSMVVAIYTAMQAGQVIATMPEATPAGDQVLQGAGYNDMGGEGLSMNDAPALQAAAATVPPGGLDMPAVADARQSDGAAKGVETPRADGVQ